MSQDYLCWFLLCKYPYLLYLKLSVFNGFHSPLGRYFRSALKEKCFTTFILRFNTEALKTIRNQQPPVSRIGLVQLEQAPVDWKRLEEGLADSGAQIQKKQPRDHQRQAIEAAHTYFLTHDRGKLIMACSTGKTYTSLCTAERETTRRGLVLFLVPSIALLGQTLREWTILFRQMITAIICVQKHKRKYSCLCIGWNKL